jgi:hypothetical protein
MPPLDHLVGPLLTHLLFWLLIREVARVLNGQVRISIRLDFGNPKRPVRKSRRVNPWCGDLRLYSPHTPGKSVK